MAKITYGNVPMFPYIDRFIHEKRQGFGWDDLGQRSPKFVVLHRMVGTLRGTDSYFRMPNISSYTDYGIGTATSDPSLKGVIYRWNDVYGRRSPWASGPVNRPFGDGAAIVAKYGINAVNRDGISLEIGGHDEPIDDFTWNRIVWFIAYWADQLQIPYTKFPLNPATGISFVIWHTEFTAGTGKDCPFPWLKNRTGKLIEDVKQFLKKYQEGNAIAPPPSAPEPVASVFKKGDKVDIVTNANIRQGSGTTAKVVTTLKAEVKNAEIIDGPREANGYTWFDVKWTGGTGWAASINLKPAKPEPTAVQPKTEFKKGDKLITRKGTVIREGSGLKYKQLAILEAGVPNEVIDGPRREDNHDWVDIKWAGGTGWTAVGNLDKREAPVVESFKQVNDVEFYWLGEDHKGREFTLIEDAWSKQWADDKSTNKKKYKKGDKVKATYFAIGSERNNEALWLVLGENINTAERLSIEHVAERPF